MSQPNIILAGNPNIGKTTLFNMLTGVRQHVGNYAGVTVDRKEGEISHNGEKINILDLPGIYSMNTYSPEEQIAREVLTNENPDLVINIVDASGIEKNLYFTLQLVEMGLPMILFLNMKDIATKQGITIKEELLESLIGIPVVSGVARKREGIGALISRGITLIKQPEKHVIDLKYSVTIEQFIEQIQDILVKHGPGERWRAIRIIEGELNLLDPLTETAQNKITTILDQIRAHYGAPAPSAMVKERYQLIKHLTDQAVIQKEVVRKSITKKLDNIIMNRHLALPIFGVMLFVLFQLVFTAGEPLMGFIETGISYVSNWISSFWAADSSSLLKSLIVDGIIAGVGGVLVFTPNIFLMFMGIAILEDTGYMARIAVIMDRMMGKVGLNGHSFLPMMMGFGCSIPAIMGTRTIKNNRERITTLFIIPFISCGARLPVYLLIISAFLPVAYQAVALWSIYAIGIIVGLLVAKILRKTTLKGDPDPLMIELPSYLTPAPRSVILHTWDRGKHFLEKAGTVILALSIILWALTTFPHYTPPEGHQLTTQQLDEQTLRYSMMGKIGITIEPAIKLMGGDWRIGSSFIAAAAAKEMFVSQLGILFSLGDEVNEKSASLQDKLKATYTLPAALAFLLFILLSMPCIATFAIVKSETKSWRWPIAQAFFMTLLAFILSVLTYQVGTFLT